jgi:putative membrane protein
LSSLIETLPHVNASLNALATALLLAGYVLIKRRQETAHKWTMLACFCVSVVFLACYLTHHYYLKYHLHLPYGSRPFPASAPSEIRTLYYLILVPHIVLAATVPFLAIATIWLGLANHRRAHNRLARWTFPIWLYVSVTGVIVYLMLYQLYPPTG